MSVIENVSRRRFVQGALAGGVLIVGARYAPLREDRAEANVT